MANIYTTQTLKDTTRVSILKLTAAFDGSGQESNNYRISANSLAHALDANNNILVNASGTKAAGNVAKPYYGISIARLWYDSNIPGYTKLTWTGDTAQTAFLLGFTQTYNDQGHWAAISNPQLGANVNGDIGVTTVGAVANNSYTIIIELHKDGTYYNQGQQQSPNAFNYPPFGVTP